MYNDNENNQEFDNGMNPDEHKAAETANEFEIKDSNNEDSYPNQQTGGEVRLNQSEPSNAYEQQDQSGNICGQQEQPTQQMQADQEDQPIQQMQADQEDQPTQQMQADQEEQLTQQMQADQEEQPTQQMQADQEEQLTLQMQADQEEQPTQQTQADQQEQPTRQMQADQQEQSTQHMQADRQSQPTWQFQADQQSQSTQWYQADQQPQPVQRYQADQQPQPVQRYQADQQPQPVQRYQADQQPQPVQRYQADQQPQPVQRYQADQQPQPVQQYQADQQPQPVQRYQADQQPQPVQQYQAGQQPQPAQRYQTGQQPQPTQQIQTDQLTQQIQPVQPGQPVQPTQPTQQDLYHQTQFQPTQTPGGSYQNSYIPPREKVKKAKGKNGKARKVAGLVAAALLFGVVSGGTMVGINTLADSFKKPMYQQVSKAALPETPPNNSSGKPQAGSALAMDVSSIVEEAMPSVVAINNTVLYQGSTWFGQAQTYEVPSSGSGIIVGQNDNELLIVTNNHVVADATNMSVVFIDNTSVKAAVKGTDVGSDLAIIAVPLKDIPEATLNQISIATLGNSDNLKVGQGVVAIGNALGYGQSVTVGYVSALNREVKAEGGVARDLLQTDAAINPGNSGGALLNMKGEVIGINAAKYSSTDVEGMGYAIPISKAEDIIKNLMTKKTREAVDADKAGSIGIQGQNVSEDMANMLGMPEGIFIYKILDGGAASKTELHEKDIIVKFDDQSVRTMADLQNMLKYYSKGETVNVTVMSLENGEYSERTIPVTLGAKSQLQVDKN